MCRFLACQFVGGKTEKRVEKVENNSNMVVDIVADMIISDG